MKILYVHVKPIKTEVEKKELADKVNLIKEVRKQS